LESVNKITVENPYDRSLDFYSEVSGSRRKILERGMSFVALAALYETGLFSERSYAYAKNVNNQTLSTTPALI